MNPLWTRSSHSAAFKGKAHTVLLGSTEWLHPGSPTAVLSALLMGCTLHSPPSFQTTNPIEEPRRPDGVAVDFEGSLPPPTHMGSTDGVLVPLKEPVDFSRAVFAVRTFFRSVANEDMQGVQSVLANDAMVLPITSGDGMRAVRHWERRFRALDYTALGSEVVYRESMVETYLYQDLESPTPGRPIRPAAMVPEDVLIRVRVTRTMLGIDRVFGPEILFVLRRQGRDFEIKALHEDFTAP